MGLEMRRQSVMVGKVRRLEWTDWSWWWKLVAMASPMDT